MAGLYDPARGAFRTLIMSTSATWDQTTISLADNRLLLTGGQSAHGASRSKGFEIQLPATSVADVFDPATDTIHRTGSMGIARDGHTATLPPDGRVLVTGGTDDTESVIADAELYR